ncbi:MAG: hypothetical protein NVS2B16_10170 [Chloroflexota bacterium]
MPTDRVVIMGSTSSGKSTLARFLAVRLGLTHIELDALHWRAGWSTEPPDVFRGRVAQALSAERWVVDGNYGVIRDLVWPRAQTLIWLDYPLSTILVRLIRRTVERVVQRRELWNGNRESLRKVFSHDSLFVWAVSTHRRRRQEFTALLSERGYSHLCVVRVRSPRETRRWVTTIVDERPSGPRAAVRQREP